MSGADVQANECFYRQECALTLRAGVCSGALVVVIGAVSIAALVAALPARAIAWTDNDTLERGASIAQAITQHLLHRHAENAHLILDA